MSKWACLLAACVLVACTEAPPYAQVDVILQCDEDLLPSATGVRFRVFQGRTNDVIRDELALIADGLTFPTTAVIVPIANDPSREFRVLAELMQGDVVIATQRLTSGFVADGVRELTLRFTSACSSRCGPLQNCVESRCEAACFEAQSGELERQQCEDFIDPCEDLDVVYCESFEEDRVQSNNVFDPGSSFERSSEVFRGSGGHSAHIYSPSGTTFAHFTISAFSSVPTEPRWMRSWWRLPPGPLDLTFFALESDMFRIGPVVDLNIRGAQAEVSVFGFAEEIIEQLSVPVPQDEWVCIETHIDFEAEQIDYFINSLNAMTVFGEIPEALHQARFGVVSRSPVAPEDYDIYIDDIVFSNDRVGCD